MLEKMQKILTLFETKPTIMRTDVMELLDASGTTATRLLTILKKEGKITQQGTRGNSASYTKP
jgi:predicted HTH transcriptional regulator